MFWKRWEEGDPLPRSFRSARWRSVLVVLLAAGFVAFSYAMMHSGETRDASAARNYWTGLFWVVVGSICFIAFLPSVFRPTRVTMDSEGFTVRNFWRGEKRYRWRDIAYFDITYGSHPMVYWLDKVRPERKWRYIHDRDHQLPSALWQHRAQARFHILAGALDEYNGRQARKRA